MSVGQVVDTRSTPRAVKRGFLGRCPNCGEGHIFRAYLKVRDQCESCGEDLHHHRSDDAPPYLTILIVGHVVGFVLFTLLATVEDVPNWVHFTLWPALVVGLSLILLPRIKGALVGLQWAQRMHGFGGDLT